MNRLALVTGGSGFFGSALTSRLRANGDRVRIFDVNRPDNTAEGVEVIQGDVRDPDALRLACEGVDVVFHTVAMQPLARDPELFESINVGGTDNLLRTAKAANVPKVVWTSSTAVFGLPDANPVSETTERRPIEHYGRTKLAGERLCEQAVAEGLDVTIVRPRTIIGSGRLGLFAVLFEFIADGAPVFVLGRGDEPFQFVHMTDLAEACRLAGERTGPSVYNVGSAEFGTMRQTLQAVIDHAGTGSRVRSLPPRLASLGMNVMSRLRLAPFGPYHWLAYGHAMYFDITRARTELGWEPSYSDAEAMIESYEWFLANRERLDVEGRSHHQKPVRKGVLEIVKKVGKATLR